MLLLVVVNVVSLFCHTQKILMHKAKILQQKQTYPLILTHLRLLFTSTVGSNYNHEIRLLLVAVLLLFV